jgi:hypothetical protein
LQNPKTTTEQEPVIGSSPMAMLIALRPLTFVLSSTANRKKKEATFVSRGAKYFARSIISVFF